MLASCARKGTCCGGQGRIARPEVGPLYSVLGMCPDTKVHCGMSRKYEVRSGLEIIDGRSDVRLLQGRCRKLLYCRICLPPDPYFVLRTSECSCARSTPEPLVEPR